MFNCEKEIDMKRGEVVNSASRAYYGETIYSTKMIIDPYGTEWYRADNLAYHMGFDLVEVWFKYNEIEWGC